jgi:hypothetical protein
VDGSYSSALGIRTSKVAHHRGAGRSGGHQHGCRESRDSTPDRPRSGTGTFRRRRRRAAALDGQGVLQAHLAPAGPRLPLRQLLIPRSSRTSLPEGPVGSRESPQPQGRKALRFTGIPAYPRSTRKRHDRPVTPEVAGSSPVAPVFRNTCKAACLVACVGANRGSEIHRLLPGLFCAGKGLFENSLQIERYCPFAVEDDPEKLRKNRSTRARAICRPW